MIKSLHMSKKAKILSLLYILFVFLSFFYIKSVLKTENVRTKVPLDKNVEDVYKINVTLNFNNENNTYYLTEEMSNVDTIIKLLEQLRKHGKLIYEKTDYTYGIEIDSVNNKTLSNGYKWAVIKDGKDITNDIANTKISKNSTLELKPIQK